MIFISKELGGNRLGTHLMRHEHRQRSDIGEESHLPTIILAASQGSLDHTACLRDIVDHAIHDLSLKRLEHDGAVLGDKLGLPAPRQHHTGANVRYRDYSDDVSELAGTCPLDVGVEFGFEELEHSGAEVGGVEEDRVR